MNRLALATVLAMLALSVVVDGLLPLEMPGSVGQLLGHAPRTAMPRNGSEAVQLAASQQVSTPPYEPSGGFLEEAATNMPESAPARGSAMGGVAIPGLKEQYGGFGVAGAVREIGAQVGGGFAEAVYLRPVATLPQGAGGITAGAMAPIIDGRPGEGPAAASSPDSPRQGTERSGGHGVDHDIGLFSAVGDMGSGYPVDGAGGGVHRTPASREVALDGLPVLGVRGGHDRGGLGGLVGGTPGVATWYGGPLFAGKPMANGQPFNPYAMTTASNRYALGTVLEVEYRRVITVTVTDRGAFTHELDLSMGAFRALVGSTEPGVIRVQVRVAE